ncbi:MAG: hypothetical protein RJB11_147, partial [Planctomycetota bacterium]
QLYCQLIGLDGFVLLSFADRAGYDGNWRFSGKLVETLAGNLRSLRFIREIPCDSAGTVFEVKRLALHEFPD